jgi:uncharacterized membrane protein YeaQ/YmgE (transglycosylase-associated protein family)
VSATAWIGFFFIYLLIWGMAAGWIAWMILGKRGQLNWTLNFVVGVIGSLLGGTVGSLLFGEGLQLRPAGIVGSIVGAVVVLAIYYAIQGRKSD